MSYLSIETLPSELLHRIFDNLDSETILLSVRLVSKLFRLVVNTYDRYALNFHLISKSNFYVICRIINPQNVISLTLSNDKRTSNQIALFISFNHLQQFTRLRFLTLLNIDESQLQFILLQVELKSLISFSFNIGKYDYSSIPATSDILTLITTQSTLRKMEMNLKPEKSLKISWSLNCTIQSLTINGDITMDNVLTILQYSPHLHTLIMSKMPDGVINNLTSPCFQQLSSLTIKELRTTIDELEPFLLMTPSLVYLKLIGKKTMDGKRCEEFLTKNLPKLKTFEFYFAELIYTKQNETELELIISSFQTPFWVKHKKWFVICECESHLLRLKTLHLCSIPRCKPSLHIENNSQKNLLSTYPITINKNSPLIMDNITLLSLNLNKLLTNDIHEKKTTGNNLLFPKVTEIHLHFCDDCPLLSLQSLSILINISQIVCIEMHNIYFKEYNQKTWLDIGIFLKQAHNLSSLNIEDSFHLYKSDQTIEIICLILPHYIKHLEIPINDLEQNTNYS